MRKHKSNEKILSEKHLLNIELKLEQRKSKKLDLEKQDLIIINTSIRTKLLEYQIKDLNQNIEILKKQKQNKLNQYQNINNDYQNYIKIITKEYKIDNENWGFDPDTGKIISDTE